MLHESKVSQKEKNVFRRWFQDDYFDLIVWYDIDYKSILGFQLCYDKNYDEHAFTWNKLYGFQHHRIDNSRTLYSYPATPILVSDGVFPFADLIKRFNISSENIDITIKNLVIEKLTEYSKV